MAFSCLRALDWGYTEGEGRKPPDTETETEGAKIMKATRRSTLGKITPRMHTAPAPVQGTGLPSPRGPHLVLVDTGAGSLVEMDSREAEAFRAQGLAVESVPVARGHDDTVMIFRSYLLRTQGDGCELSAALTRMVARAPEIAAQVIFASSLGEISRGRAVASLRGYLDNGVAVAPMGL